MDILNFSLTFILGFFIILFYSLFLPKNKYVWGTIKNFNIQLWIIISIFISAISYIIIWTRNVFYKQNDILYTIGNTIFLIGAILWPIYLHYFPTKFHSVILTLSISSLGVLLILINECQNKDIIGIIFGCYLFFHVFCIDNIYWSHSYRMMFPSNAKNGW
jgi:hypothetical protein